MKKLILLLSFLFVLGQTHAQNSSAQELFYFVEVKNFMDGEDHPYVEILLNLDAGTLIHLKNDSGNWTSEVGIALQVVNNSGDGATADYVNKFILKGPALKDTSAANINYTMMDLRRILLEPGNYTLTGFIVDRNDPGLKEHKFQRDIVVEKASMTSVTMSGIEFIRSFKPSGVSSQFTKLGYEVTPLGTSSAFVDNDSVIFYSEVYNSDKFLDEFYFASVYLTRANSTVPLEGFKRTLKIPSKGLDVITSSFNISKLPSETYYLNIDIYNRENQVAAGASEKMFVSNSTVETKTPPASNEDWLPFNLSEDQLNYYIPILAYISTESEKQFAKVAKTFEDKKNFFYNFWVKRKDNPADPAAQAWKQYQATIEYVNQHYKAVYREGWKNDRGRVMLMYGPPNDVEQHFMEDDRYPNEIWKYNRLRNQANVTFVFYDPDGITGDFPLLHSDKIGENPNPRWKLELVKRNTAVPNVDKDNVDGPNIHPFRD